VQIADWRGGEVNVEAGGLKDYDDEHFLVKEEKMLDGKLKRNLERQENRHDLRTDPIDHPRRN